MDIYVPPGFRGDDVNEKTFCDLCKAEADPEYFCKRCQLELCYSHRGDWHKCYLVPNTVDHPQHYNTGRFEVIDVIEDWKLGFNLGNAIKYIARADHKGNRREDLEKARWYLEREISKGATNGS